MFLGKLWEELAAMARRCGQRAIFQIGLFDHHTSKKSNSMPQLILLAIDHDAALDAS